MDNDVVTRQLFLFKLRNSFVSWLWVFFELALVCDCLPVALTVYVYVCINT